MNSNQLIARAVLRNVLTKRNAGHYTKRVHPVPTMNDLPKPSGDFFILHAERNKKYNLVLGLGIIALSSALYTAYSTNLINLNHKPPATYE